MPRLFVGHAANSVNPRTHAPEFNISDDYKNWKVDPPSGIEIVNVVGRRPRPFTPRIIPGRSATPTFPRNENTSPWKFGKVPPPETEEAPELDDQIHFEPLSLTELDPHLASLSTEELLQVKENLQNYVLGLGISGGFVGFGAGLMVGVATLASIAGAPATVLVVTTIGALTAAIELGIFLKGWDANQTINRIDAHLAKRG